MPPALLPGRPNPGLPAAAENRRPLPNMGVCSWPLPAGGRLTAPPRAPAAAPANGLPPPAVLLALLAVRARRLAKEDASSGCESMGVCAPPGRLLAPMLLLVGVGDANSTGDR